MPWLSLLSASLRFTRAPRWETSTLGGDAQAQPDVAFTHSAFEGWVKHHATGQKWPLRAWEQGRFTMPRN
jgi:hypothetical protein